jgi:hypothetical protein
MVAQAERNRQLNLAAGHEPPAACDHAGDVGRTRPIAVGVRTRE